MNDVPPKDNPPDTLRTKAVEDFLKAVYLLQRQGDAVSTSALAGELKIQSPSVTEMAKKLAEHGLLEYERYRGLRLTETGQQIALEVIRRHRLLEMYLVDALGYSWDQVHEEAERLEHVISRQFVDRIAAALGDPDHDPHGDPIPAADGSLPDQNLTSLADLPLHQTGQIRRITAQSPEALRYLGQLGLIPGAQVIVTAHDPFDGPVHLLVDNTPVVVGAEMARHILLTLPGQE